MRGYHIRATTLPLLLLLAVKATAAPGHIEVFTSSAYPTRQVSAMQSRGAVVTVYEIDDIEQINADLAKDLPRDEKRATAILRERFAKHNTAIQQRYINCADGIFKAYGYEIDRYPAVVFDGQGIVYGVPDLERAYQHYQAWESGNRR